MRLISLTANGAGFHPVKFNRRGASFILGKQKARDEKDKSQGQTYNGVGKSLLLYLINYCLGAEVKESFTSQLAGWEFVLTIEIGGHEVPITRRISDSGMILFGTEELTLKDFRERIQVTAFPGTEDLKFLTFRSLMGLFLRPGKSAYTWYDGIHFSEKPVQKQIRSAYLLGLDVGLVLAKYELVQELRDMQDMSKRFAKDAIIKEYFHGKKDVNLDIRDLQEELAVLQKSLDEFRVAENYHEVEQSLGELKARLQKMRNAALATENKLRQVEDSLKTKNEITLEGVREAFARASVHFPPPLIRSIEEVEQFHFRLLSMREVRLKKEKKGLETRLAGMTTNLKTLNTEIDQNLRFLNDHGALGELLSLKDRANEVRNTLQRLLDFKELTKKYKDRSAELQVDLANANLASQHYLAENEETINEAAETFRKLAKRIYPGKQSGLTIENDLGENQTRFKIDVKILDDASDGINEAKIFAYDMTLVSLRRNHDVQFLCHDSRLFSDIDPRQRAPVFQIAADLSEERDFQYIATVNEDQVEAIRPVLGDDEFKRVVLDRVVLELKDDSAEDKLLGLEVDLDYD